MTPCMRRLREIYEQTLRDCEIEVKKAQKEKEAAASAIMKVMKGPMPRLGRAHASHVETLNPKP